VRYKFAGKNMRLLFVESDKDTLDTAKASIASCKCMDEVVGVNDGLEALKLFYDERFDVVLTGIVLPGMNGVELCKNIKKDSPKTYIIVSSGVLCDYMETLLSLGVDAFLPKPYGIKRLRSILKMSVILSQVDSYDSRLYANSDTDKLISLIDDVYSSGESVIDENRHKILYRKIKYLRDKGSKFVGDIYFFKLLKIFRECYLKGGKYEASMDSLERELDELLARIEGEKILR